MIPALVIAILIESTIIFIASKITSVNISFMGALACVVISSFFALIPGFGFLLSIVVFFVLMGKWSGADWFPDVLLLVIVAKGISFAVSLLFLN